MMAPWQPGLRMLIWTPEMSVGVAVLDEDHKNLIAMINELHDAMQAGKGRAVFGGILERLGDYTIEHFGREEALLAATGYAALDLHHHVHEKLKADVAEIRRKFAEGDDMCLTIDTLDFLQNWLRHHILETDMRYRAHLNARGVR